MHSQTLENHKHKHDFSVKNEKGERRTLYVLIITAITMVVEIIAGSVYGSMALLADGWHMSTHVAAFMLALFAYSYARKHADNPAFAFGTGKVNALGGFASAIALVVVALMMMVESLERIVNPQTIYFNEAIMVASAGLLVNIVSVFLLKDDHSHHHHDHEHDHDHHCEHDHGDDEHDHNEHEHDHHDDHNLKAAYLHVLADAMTSLLAIVALVAGKYFGWNFLDPVIGVVGAIIITRWSLGLLKQTSPILLDASIEKNYQEKIIEVIEQDADNRVSDIHVWKVSANHYAAIISLVTHYQKSTDHYKNLLNNFHELSHVTVEVNVCEDEPCLK
jgi:cation diffusion facilitator family transporter